VEITRHEIVSVLQEGFISNSKVLAMWLEGADANNTIDQYSDIDLCGSVQAGVMAEITDYARNLLEKLAPLDLIETLDAGEDHQHTVFHLAGTSKYLLVDLVLFVGRGSDFIEGDEIEKPLVLFDHHGVIRSTIQEEQETTKKNNQRIQKLKDAIAQSSRIEKYVHRGLFLEAYGYYHRWLLEPLVEILRIRYTPLHPDYYIVHISHHLPPHVLRRLENLFQVNTLAEIEEKSKEALLFFDETLRNLQAG
jgi:hypothetical protein